jgi:hypothetical protein
MTEQGRGFRAVAVPARRIESEIEIGKDARERLGLSIGDEAAHTLLQPQG